ncbi:murein hydrolase activator EnvC family protein [Legionella bononiensis]|uniref:Peptidoglycan DD-metalloendopeptidase family protein n=1 Tax=Legionella bononiensis TaxID=2793102 RepID=A0ABS1W903_9GAMM|nr:peptidoglycan DD-metalloendopeptidase family protein [Legionella bononiensis]MBL7479652.1 peptidoglycan DD-metalloendopeptidase family protein [Legionella bononiensis]MBL7525836.1 peptidoglycan DD-metalloendopeptidase family protein [Legionella bononiensis]MBL7562358.1 peptidoglycan DD-metalloendopeptidase family protein [Legionella bononiensis]
MPTRSNQYSLKFTFLSGIALGMLINFGLAAKPGPSPVAQTQTKLKQLDAQINNLRQTLATAHDKRGILDKELSGTEKQIGEGIHKLRSIQYDIKSKEQKIAELHAKAEQLNQQLATQQQLLASHVRARYQMGEYQPLKWILNQDDPYKISRILTYYQYIIKSRQELIDKIDETRINLSENKDKLHNELAENQKLQNELSQHQQQLEQNKRYHTTLIQSLNNEIQNKQHDLQEFQKDKANLSRLLKSLSQQSVVQSSKPFVQMRRKLPLPVQNVQRSLRRMNQGVTFFADEGAVVTAVYPGKVVFSDWLKGYGLLLIIDHGQGFMTLYAHNQSLFKHKGQTVRQNEQIASVGHSGGIKQNGLYFEIRLRGKAVPPLDWLS